MILPFSTHINKKETLFVDKIIEGLISNNIITEKQYDQSVQNYIDADYDFHWFTKEIKGKIHTIRKDENNRWKVGTMIDFFINSRTKDMFRFAPRVPVVSIQKIKIKYFWHSLDYNKKVEVYVDNCFLGQYYFNKVNPNGESELIKLAQNDGFDSVEDFFNYFNEDFEGKIIHWTDLKY